MHRRRSGTAVSRVIPAVAAVISIVGFTACTVDTGVTAGRSESIERPSPTITPDPRVPEVAPTAEPEVAGELSDVENAPTRPWSGPILELGDLTLADVAVVDAGKPPRSHDDMVAATLIDLERWLTEIHPEIYGTDWLPLSGGVHPAHPGRTDIPGCGEPVTEYRDIQEYIAFYCGSGDFIVYDDGDQSVLGALAAEFGTSIFGVVLAHEYGHVIQQRTGDLQRGLPTILTEQQADCFAGSWVGRAASGRSDVVRLDDSDVRGALIAMVAVRDPVGTDQFEIGGHGTAFDRVGAFQQGFLFGPERCAELIDDPLPLMPNQFQSLTDARNDGDLPLGYGDGMIVPLVVETLNAYWQFQIGDLDPPVAAAGFPRLQVIPLRTITDATCRTDVIGVAPGLVVCLPELTVFLDDGIARALYDDPIVGSADFAVGYLIGLGWSEVVQILLGSELVGEPRALANDCLAGAWTRDMLPERQLRPDETERIGTISPGDLDEVVVAAIEIGDDSFDDQVLGTAFEKIAAFRSGVLGGIDVCLDRIRS